MVRNCIGSKKKVIVDHSGQGCLGNLRRLGTTAKTTKNSSSTRPTMMPSTEYPVWRRARSDQTGTRQVLTYELQEEVESEVEGTAGTE